MDLPFPFQQMKQEVPLSIPQLLRMPTPFEGEIGAKEQTTQWQDII